MKLKSLNELCDADYEAIKVQSSKFFTPREVAVMLDIDVEAFIIACDIENGPVYRAFFGGRLQRENDLRDKIIKLAESGSSPAQMMLIDIIKRSSIKMMDR